MIGKTIEKYEGVLYAPITSGLNLNINNNNNHHHHHHRNSSEQSLSSNMINDNSSYLSNNVDEAKVMIATSLGFLTGIIHVFIYLFICKIIIILK
jgi:hypothetical protein